MLVVDASAVAELLLRSAAGATVARTLREHDFDLHAPHMLDVEVLSALRRVVAVGATSSARAREALDDFLDLPIARYPHDALAPRIWQLRENFSAYDAAYVALAEVIADDGAPLLTADARLARATDAHTDVRVVRARPLATGRPTPRSRPATRGSAPSPASRMCRTTSNRWMRRSSACRSTRRRRCGPARASGRPVSATPRCCADPGTRPSA